MEKRIESEKIDNIILLFIYTLVGLLKWFPILQTIGMIVVILGICYFSLKQELHKLAPLFIFFNSSILYFNGIAICDLFFVLYILSYLRGKRFLNKKHMHPMLLVFSIYAITVMASYDLLLGMEVLLSLVFCFLFLNDMLKRKLWMQFCDWYIIGILTATIYGIKIYIDSSINLLEGESFRYILTFTDPNYAGMFLSIGLYMLILLKNEFGVVKRYLGIAVCIVSILLTMSSSAIFCNVVVVVMLIFSKGLRNINLKLILKSSCMIIIFLFVFLGVIINYFPSAKRSLERFGEKVEFLKEGDLGNATTERSDLWNKHLDYFWNQENPIKILIGGNYLTDKGFDKRHFSVVSHEVYIDSLICFGCLGTMCYIVTVLHQLYNKWRKRKISPNHTLIFVISLIWTIYSFILSMFPFWAFVFFLFVDIKEEDSKIANKEFNT